MEYEKIKSKLSAHNKQNLSIFISYLEKIEKEKDRDGQIKNKWFKFFTADQACDIYEKVAKDGLFIDGDTITLQFKGAVIVSYNYQAYKNRLLQVYPETLFDIQNVYEGDKFSFKKDSGHVNYIHEIMNPFAVQRKLIGCYCIIKNKRGEFIETLNETEIKKMKAVSKTTQIWETWYEEMTLKSVIKRACKRHFKDITTNIDVIDNENNDLSLLSGVVVADSLIEEIKNKISKMNTVEDLLAYFKENHDWTDSEDVISLFTERREEIEKQK